MLKILPQEIIEYPEEDGNPMAESDYQIEPLMDGVKAFRWRYRHDPQVYVSGNLLIYYEEGNPKVSVSPDVFIVFGVPKHKRRSYKTWEEGKGPDVVLEITSKSTRTVDEQKKPEIYRQLEVKEYFQYDPTGDYLTPALKGRWLDEDGVYQPIGATHLPNSILTLDSHLLQVEFHLDQGQLRIFDPQTEEYLYTYDEAVEQLEEAEVRANEAEAMIQTERQARLEAEQALRQAEAEKLALEEKLREAGLL